MLRRFLALTYISILPLAATDYQISGQINQQKLKSLTEHQRMAGNGISIYQQSWTKYSFDYHKNGDSWPEEALQRLFHDGLFQYYAHELAGWDGVMSYSQYLTFEKNKIKFHPYDIESLIALFAKNQLPMPPLSSSQQTIDRAIIEKSLGIANWLEAVGNALRLKNNAFKKLGGDFQRQKIIVEKEYSTLLKETDFTHRETIANDLLQQDQKVENMQTLIFHWMKEVYAQATQILQTEYQGGTIPTKESHGDFIRKIETYLPDFVFWPFYKDLVNVE